MPVNSPQFIPSDVWFNVIHPEVLKQCDQLDGVCGMDPGPSRDSND